MRSDFDEWDGELVSVSSSTNYIVMADAGGLSGGRGRRSKGGRDYALRCLFDSRLSCGHLGDYIALARWNDLRSVINSAISLFAEYAFRLTILTSMSSRKSLHAATPSLKGLNLLSLVANHALYDRLQGSAAQHCVD